MAYIPKSNIRSSYIGAFGHEDRERRAGLTCKGALTVDQDRVLRAAENRVAFEVWLWSGEWIVPLVVFLAVFVVVFVWVNRRENDAIASRPPAKTSGSLFEWRSPD